MNFVCSYYLKKVAPPCSNGQGGAQDLSCRNVYQKPFLIQFQLVVLFQLDGFHHRHDYLLGLGSLGNGIFE